MSKVSIIIPCFNQGQYIQETLDSIFDQTFNDWDIVIVNDGSTDEFTNSFLGNYSHDKTIILNIPNGGVSNARNVGILHAKGQYILPLDADDKIGPDYLLEGVDILDNYPGVKVVYANGSYFGDLSGIIDLPSYDSKTIISQNLIFNSAVFRKEAIIQAGLYDTEFALGWEDWELWLRMVKEPSEVYKLDGVHYYYRIKNESRNSSLVNDRLEKVEQQLFLRHINLFLKYYSSPLTLIREYEHLKQNDTKLLIYEKQIKNSIKYKTGHFLLYPISLVFSLYKRVFKK
jgi:glycosyltransferase involved in cell wall biosynthesis